MKTISSQNIVAPLPSNSNLLNPSSNEQLNQNQNIQNIFGNKISELKNKLKMQKMKNAQLLTEIQNLNKKSNDLVGKRNNLLVTMNQQKSQIYILKNKNDAYRNYLNDLANKDFSGLTKKKTNDDNIFNAIKTISENIQNNISAINEILKQNSGNLNIGNDGYLNNIPLQFLQNIEEKKVSC